MPKIQPDIEVIHGDCIQEIKHLGKFDFVFADPPFNIGQDYKGYDDNLFLEDYAEFTYNWVKAGWNSCNGIMALHGPDTLAEMYLMISSDLTMRRIAWVNWHYRFGQCNRNNWIDARCHCLIHAKPKKHTWNPDDVLVESDRVAYKDKRVTETDRGGQRLPGTVWGVPSDGPYWGRVQGNSKERVSDRPNQLPELYLARLIKAYTNPGDRVLDMFGGTGGVACVCKALGRDCVTIEITKEGCNTIKERLLKGAIRV